LLTVLSLYTCSLVLTSWTPFQRVHRVHCSPLSAAQNNHWQWCRVAANLLVYDIQGPAITKE
jgi:hypothetical protein